MNRLITITLSVIFALSAFAQQFTATGIVSSKTDDEPLVGVTVRVKGTNKATATDINGKFAIQAQVGDVLDFTYIGFVPKHEKLTSQSPVTVVMEEDASELDEVVVVGYGSVKRITLTGAASNIDAEQIRRVPTSSVQNALSGKLPG
ncbi:MAG: carboxypeptidase-like regulatory domain-containing protein, partial [Muribaculaceae bacterium]|nr:carboxypeptidase-like regulatory domain-containing protein [Muribaculaceae bacterium]